jgi:hypothetical protein
MSFKFIGTEVVFSAQIGEFKAEVTARASLCGSNHLPDEYVEPAVSGMLRYLQAVKDGRNVRNLEHLREILQEGPRGLRIMAKERPQEAPEKDRKPICWDPSQTTFKKL